MRILIICKYCDYKWDRNVYSAQSPINEGCPRCKSKDLNVKPLDEAKVDYYAGCPPFPLSEQLKDSAKKEEKDKDWYWG